MSYAQYSEILASDLNTLIGTDPTTTANTVNTVWGTGGSAAGYGQTPVPTVNQGDEIYAVNWANLITKTANSALHQGSGITSVTVPVTGNEIQYISAIPTNLSTIYNNRLNAAIQGTTSANTATIGSTWSTYINFTFTASFANGDAARYFFNSGGQLKFTFAQPTGNAISNVFHNLANAAGTIVLSAPASGTANIVGTSYNGVTKVGGSGTANTISTNSGYYGLTTANTTLFSQTATGTPSGYSSSSISLIGKTNGTQGTHGDNGSVLTFYSVWQESPTTGSIVAAGGNMTITAVYPETSNIGNTWGTVSLTATTA